MGPWSFVSAPRPEMGGKPDRKPVVQSESPHTHTHNARDFIMDAYPLIGQVNFMPESTILTPSAQVAAHPPSPFHSARAGR
jgi:hypothetical protein